ncbi:hypothetical protein M440DRAFT_1339450 [Trichoderma longibrachiatum ATCC 18648]|uniref:DUF676 domain-containing protein n=1 Tax=Trichoderma longibrachiatum ATCC 18648 TaxID=983965 RepID=A0A2T4BVM4_TRILO|nr:hypothetical protein M440DRAFT_1339450 [Trichoderma longibrachiatum ATCC 18648]
MGLGNLSLLATVIAASVTYYWVLRRLTRANVQPDRTKRPDTSPNVRTTFRVSGVPIDWGPEQLRSFLSSKTSTTDVVVESLAHEAGVDLQTATVSLGTIPLQLQSGRTWQIQLPQELEGQVCGEQCLAIETDFHGITTLYAPPPEDHRIDIVALSGLGHHAFGAFTDRKGTHMWLRDSLPWHLTSETSGKPMARVMIYGYESAIAGSKNMQNIEDLATTFHSSLYSLAADPTKRRIILIGHSFGGLIIKQTLISLSRSKNPDDVKILRAVCGVIFIGTPHDGMDISSLVPMVRDGANRSLIESISRLNSQVLSIQQRDFHRALGDEGDLEVFCFYETVESPRAQQDEDGKWTMTGPPAAFLVTKSSATYCRPWNDGPEYSCAIARSHSDLVRFGPHDADYRTMKERIKGIARRALEAQRTLQAAAPKVPAAVNIGLDKNGDSTEEDVANASLVHNSTQYKCHGERNTTDGLVQAANTRAREVDEKHVNTLAYLNNRELAFVDEGRWKEAENLWSQLAEKRKQILPRGE